MTLTHLEWLHPQLVVSQLGAAARRARESTVYYGLSRTVDYNTVSTAVTALLTQLQDNPRAGTRTSAADRPVFVAAGDLVTRAFRNQANPNTRLWHVWDATATPRAYAWVLAPSYTGGVQRYSISYAGEPTAAAAAR